MNVTWIVIALMLSSPVVAATPTTTEWRTPVKPMMTSSVPLPIEGRLPSFGRGPKEWLNSPPLAPDGLRGKVVLVDIWNYSCINWIRQVPYVRAWNERYKDHGLVVIGVHSPEFGFETDVDNVRRAAKAMGVTYPIVMDSDHAIWRAFDNEAWPALYFIDAQGRIRHHYYGEGAYDQAEEILQQLLMESGRPLDPQAPVSITPQGVEAQADWRSLRTPETYTGYERAENFASPEEALRDARRVYTAPARLTLNQWALSGDWTIGPQPTRLNAAPGRIALRFHSRDLHLVMGMHGAGARARFRVLLDGHAPGSAHGLDVDAEGNGVVAEPRLYQLIRQPAPVRDHTFEIEFLDPGVETFSFTFG